MKRNLFALAALALALSACSSAKNETRALQERLAEAETAVKLSAENSRRLEGMYSDI